jgi:hypothetical protein
MAEIGREGGKNSHGPREPETGHFMVDEER